MGTTSVADALFTKVQQRVLAVLFGHPDRSFYLQQIVALAGSGTGAVQRELARLESAGLVTATRVGKQKHYQADPKAPVYEELRGLVLKTIGLAEVVRDALAPMAPDVRSAFIFGSMAKGAAVGPTSDVDVMVVSDTLAYPELFAALEGAATRLGRPVNPTIYTPDELARRVREGNAFATRVLDGPKLWLIGGPDDLPAR